jgi:hypothetical protein
MVMNLQFAKYAVLTMMLDDDLSFPGCQYMSTGNHSTSQGTNIPDDVSIIK